MWGIAGLERVADLGTGQGQTGRSMPGVVEAPVQPLVLARGSDSRKGLTDRFPLPPINVKKRTVGYL